jgi:shikimate dehydrogenase
MTTTTSQLPDRYGLVGHPVHHSRSPVIHARFARQTGQHLTYELIDAEPAAFEAAVRGFADAGGKGLNVTVPHKEAACRLADELGEEAAAAGAVNTLRLEGHKIFGDNTDGIGFLRDVTSNLGCELHGARALILGAGGAARGIVLPLLRAGVAELVLANRTLERALQVRDAFAARGPIAVRRFEELEDGTPFDVVINATSAGLHGEQPPFSAAVVGPRSFCYDLVYAPGTTPFVTWAREHGARVVEQGWGMLVEQAAESFRIWRGVRPETADLIAELKARGTIR